MAVMGHDDPSLPFDLKFPFQNKSILIKSNLINEMTNQPGQQMKHKMQVKVKSVWFLISIRNVNFDLIFISKLKFKCGLILRDDSN